MKYLNPLSEIFVCLFLLDFLPACTGGSPGYDRGLSPTAELGSDVPFSSCRCDEYLSRISDLEGRLSLMKSQAKIVFDKASKSHGLMKQVSILEDEVSSLVAKITHFEECDSILVGIVESICEMLLCKLPRSLLFYACFGLLLANSLLRCRFMP
jgi:hypothetical protein